MEDKRKRTGTSRLSKENENQLATIKYHFRPTISQEKFMRSLGLSSKNKRGDTIREIFEMGVGVYQRKYGMVDIPPLIRGKGYCHQTGVPSLRREGWSIAWGGKYFGLVDTEEEAKAKVQEILARRIEI